MHVPIVFVHGLRTSKTMWRPQLEMLGAQGRTVVAVDLPAGTNLVAWLFTILRNAHINQGKRYRREVRDVDGAFAAALTSPAEQEHRIGLIELQTALAELPVEQRETLLLVVLPESIVWRTVWHVVGRLLGGVGWSSQHGTSSLR